VVCAVRCGEHARVVRHPICPSAGGGICAEVPSLPIAAWTRLAESLWKNVSWRVPHAKFSMVLRSVQLSEPAAHPCRYSVQGSARGTAECPKITPNS